MSSYSSSKGGGCVVGNGGGSAEAVAASMAADADLFSELAGVIRLISFDTDKRHGIVSTLDSNSGNGRSNPH